MSFNPLRPFDALPLLPPVHELESKAVLKRCVAATRALAELKGAGDLLPDQAILINAIPLQEAKLSSEIENIVTTQDDLYQGMLDDSRHSDPQVKEVLRYRAALHHGFLALAERPLSLQLIREVCSLLRDESVDFRSPKQQVHLGDAVNAAVVYTPPNGGPVLQEKLLNLQAFLLADNGLDPLVRMAVSHYQFEAIHPFDDGNGRTGRILNILFLLQAKLLRIPVLYLSRYIIQHKSDYFRLLRRVTETGEWEPWLLYMLSGIEETALWTTGRIQAVRELFDKTVELCRKELPRVYSKELVELLFRQPYCKATFLVDAGIAKRQTASEYLQELAALGILVGEKRGREVIFKYPALLQTLAA